MGWRGGGGFSIQSSIGPGPSIYYKSGLEMNLRRLGRAIDQVKPLQHTNINFLKTRRSAGRLGYLCTWRDTGLPPSCVLMPKQTARQAPCRCQDRINSVYSIHVGPQGPEHSVCSPLSRCIPLVQSALCSSLAYVLSGSCQQFGHKR